MRKKDAWIKIKTKTNVETYINVAHIVEFFKSHNITYIHVDNKETPIVVNGDITQQLANVIHNSTSYSVFEIGE